MAGVARILLTGFDPFDDAARNPSGEVAQALDGEVICGAAVRGIVLPTKYDASMRELAAAIEAWQPDVVVSLGVAEGRAEITPERVAINLDRTSIPDNAGDLRLDQPIRAGGEAAYFTRLPSRAIVDALKAAKIPARESLSAGAFVCNHVFYETLELLEGSPVRSGFIHVPALPGMVADDEPSMTLDRSVRAIRLALETITAS
ncbi:MAG TPA: pyroglutamyl-peptidase I [Candidatus Limnocylindrales bacterium]|nr:pyroglutamyl-peptidase I [Candidatus Limnocylindrales bacterium]